MTYGLPARDEVDWDVKLNASVDAVKTTADTATTDLSAHKANTANPHAVTKAQVGLGNVDNTSDASKPVSTAQQTALDGKVPKWAASTAYTAGDAVMAPDGSIVKAKATFTSGATYSSANWTTANTYTGTQARAELDAVYARVGVVAPGVSGVVGDGTTDDTSAVQAVINGSSYVYIAPGTYLISSALTVPSNTTIEGAGDASLIKASATLASGGTGIGQRLLDATGSSNFHVRNLGLDASAITSFSGGVRLIWGDGASDFSVQGCHLVTPGAGTAFIRSSKYLIADNRITLSATDSVAHHDGVIDQWGGNYDFCIRNNIINGASIGKIGIMVTGENNIPTLNQPTPCTDFSISGNLVYGVTTAGIHVNGREGINRFFTITGNVVRDVSQYHGIIVQDSTDFAVTGNTVKNVASNGIRLQMEGSEGGVTGCRDFSVTGNVVRDVNQLALTTDDTGSAIVVGGSSGGCIDGNRVAGTAHRYAIVIASGTTKVTVGGGNSFAAGTLGTVNNAGGPTVFVPSGGYTPTLTGVANVASSSSSAVQWTRAGDLVTVWGRVTVTPTAAASTATQLGISLPVASTLASATTDLFGTGATQFGTVAAFSADTTNGRAQMQFPSTSTAANVFYYSFSYRVLS